MQIHKEKERPSKQVYFHIGYTKYPSDSKLHQVGDLQDTNLAKQENSVVLVSVQVDPIDKTI